MPEYEKVRVRNVWKPPRSRVRMLYHGPLFMVLIQRSMAVPVNGMNEVTMQDRTAEYSQCTAVCVPENSDVS